MMLCGGEVGVAEWRGRGWCCVEGTVLSGGEGAVCILGFCYVRIFSFLL